MVPSPNNRGRSPANSFTSSPPKLTKRSRKFTALRAPPKTPSTNGASHNVPRIYVTLPSVYSDDFPPHLRELMMSLTNDRYPGAPGTALAKAREASEREATRIRRERKRLADRQEELERLGVVVPGVTKNGSGAVNGNGKERRTRKGTPQSTAASGRSASPAAPTIRETRKTNGSRRTPNLGGAVDPDMLPVPGSSSHDVGGSTTSSGRTRRPASRGTSPIPLTVANAALSGAASAATTSAPFQSSPLASHSFDAGEGAMQVDRAVSSTTAPRSPSLRPPKRKASALSNEVIADGASDNEDALISGSGPVPEEGSEAGAAAKKARLSATPTAATRAVTTSPMLTVEADFDGGELPEGGAGGYDSDVSATGRLSRTTRTPKRFEGIQLRRSASRSSPAANPGPLPPTTVAD